MRLSYSKRLLLANVALATLLSTAIGAPAPAPMQRRMSMSHSPEHKAQSDTSSYGNRTPDRSDSESPDHTRSFPSATAMDIQGPDYGPPAGGGLRRSTSSRAQSLNDMDELGTSMGSMNLARQPSPGMLRLHSGSLGSSGRSSPSGNLHDIQERHSREASREVPSPAPPADHSQHGHLLPGSTFAFHGGSSSSRSRSSSTHPPRAAAATTAGAAAAHPPPDSSQYTSSQPGPPRRDRTHIINRGSSHRLVPMADQLQRFKQHTHDRRMTVADTRRRDNRQQILSDRRLGSVAGILPPSPANLAHHHQLPPLNPSSYSALSASPPSPHLPPLNPSPHSANSASSTSPHPPPLHPTFHFASSSSPRLNPSPHSATSASSTSPHPPPLHPSFHFSSPASSHSSHSPHPGPPPPASAQSLPQPPPQVRRASDSLIGRDASGRLVAPYHSTNLLGRDTHLRGGSSSAAAQQHQHQQEQEQAQQQRRGKRALSPPEPPPREINGFTGGASTGAGAARGFSAVPTGAGAAAPGGFTGLTSGLVRWPGGAAASPAEQQHFAQYQQHARQQHQQDQQAQRQRQRPRGMGLFRTQSETSVLQGGMGGGAAGAAGAGSGPGGAGGAWTGGPGPGGSGPRGPGGPVPGQGQGTSGSLWVPGGPGFPPGKRGGGGGGSGSSGGSSGGVGLR